MSPDEIFIVYHHAHGDIGDFDGELLFLNSGFAYLRDIATAWIECEGFTPLVPEFCNLIDALDLYISTSNSCQPLDVTLEEFINAPRALQTVYEKMDINIAEGAFLDMAKALFQYLETLDVKGHDLCDSVDIFGDRCLPTAVTKMKLLLEITHDKHRNATFDEVSFFDMVNAWESSLEYDGYVSTGNDLVALRDLGNMCAGYSSYVDEAPLHFHKFLALPAEVRAMVIREYMTVNNQVRKHLHSDIWGNPCCLWNPDVLVACDNKKPGMFPNPGSARTPSGWLPSLAYTSKGMLGEVTVLMLQQTKRFDLKYYPHVPGFKIATWFRLILEAIPHNEGLVPQINP